MSINPFKNSFEIETTNSTNNVGQTKISQSKSAMSPKIESYKSVNEDDFQCFDIGENYIDTTNMGSQELNAELERLNSEKTTATSNKTVADDEISAVTSFSHPELASLKEEMENAYEEYQNALSNDASSNPEIENLKNEQDSVKTEIETKTNEISTKENEINTKENEISEQNSTIAGFQSELSTLQSQLAAVPSNIEGENAEEQNAAYEAQRQAIQGLINLKQEQLTLAEAKLARLEDENETLKNEKEQLEKEKEELQNKEKEIQNSLEQLISDTTQKATETYNTKKEALETTQQTMLENSKEKSRQYQEEINAIDAQIVQIKNAQREQGEYTIRGDEVIALAKQYEGLTNNDMKDIIEQTGTRFDNGAWCADFATAMMKKVYGANSTPNDFANSCSMYCSVPKVVEWAEQNGLTTTDQAEVKPGDAIIVNNGQHIGFVVSINSDGTINTIEGNTLDDSGNYDELNPGQVNKRRRNQNEVTTYIKFQF